MSLRILVVASVVAAGSICPAFAQTSSATFTRTVSLPPAGLASTETAQINVVNFAGNPPTTSKGTAASCTGSILFLNSSGGTIGSPTSFTVTSGQTASATLAFSIAGLTGVRGVIRGQIQLTGAFNVPCSLGYSFETFDSTTGATNLYFASPVSDAAAGVFFPLPLSKPE